MRRKSWKPKNRQYKKQFRVEYYFWGHGSYISKGWADRKGFCDDLQEAYANASRHLGRGSVYFRAVIIDNDNEQIICIATRRQHGIQFDE